MIRTSLAEADARDLKAIAPPGTTPARNILLGTLPISAGIFVVVYLVSRSLSLAAVLSLGLGTTSLVSNYRFFRGVARRTSQQTDARAVEVIDVDASRVFDIEPLGSHGPAMVFFTEDGKALLLIGQWLLEQRKFPTRSFCVRRWSDTGKPIRVESRGPRIKPEHSAIQVPSTTRIRDIEIFDATPETLEHDLKRAFT